MSGVRNAVARRDEAAAQAPAPVSLAEVAKQAIDHQTVMLDAILPAHVSRQRFSAMTLQAMKDTPQLLNCFATREGGASFILAVGQAALVGLEVNTPLEHAWIQPRRFKDQAGNWQQGAELSIGYRGLLVLIRRTGNVRYAGAEVVYSNDEFEWGHGLEGDFLTHRPAKGDRGDLAYAYAVVRPHRGDPIFEVLNRDEVHARRASSESWKRDQSQGSAKSPWSQPHRVDRMWRKSAVRAIFPYLDSSVEVQRVLASDEQMARYDPERRAIDVTSDDGTSTSVSFDVDLPEIGTGSGSVAHDGPSQAMATDAQLRAVNTLLGAKKGARGSDRFFELDEILDRSITSTKELTFDEASQVIDVLGSLPDLAPPDDGPGSEPFTQGGAS